MRRGDVERFETAVNAVLRGRLTVDVVENDIIEIAGTKFRTEWIASGGIREADLLARSQPPIELAVAPQWSLAARELLNQAGIGWVDESGAAQFAKAGVLVSVSGHRAPAKPLSRWTPAVIAIAEALLTGVPPTVETIESSTGLSRGSCSQGLRYLEQQNLLESQFERGPRSGRRISDRRTLLGEFTGAVARKRVAHTLDLAVTWRDVFDGIRDLGTDLSILEIDWAVCGLAAAEIYAPHRTNTSVIEVYVKAQSAVDLTAVAHRVGLIQAKGGRLKLKSAPSESVFRLGAQIDEIRVTSWPRAYAESFHQGVRGEEAAENIWEIYGA